MVVIRKEMDNDFSVCEFEELRMEHRFAVYQGDCLIKSNLTFEQAEQYIIDILEIQKYKQTVQ
jgi:hypothetical protein